MTYQASYVSSLLTLYVDWNFAKDEYTRKCLLYLVCSLAHCTSYLRLRFFSSCSSALWRCIMFEHPERAKSSLFLFLFVQDLRIPLDFLFVLDIRLLFSVLNKALPISSDSRWAILMCSKSPSFGSYIMMKIQILGYCLVV